jgi:hypothetical protein
MTTPVPAAAPLPKPSTVSMSTTPGSTLAAMTDGSEETPLLPPGSVAVLVDGPAAGTVVGVEAAGADTVGCVVVWAVDWLFA